MTQVAEQTAEIVADNVEEAIDGVVEVVEVAKNNIPLLVAVFVAGVAGGAGLGYFIAAKKLGREFDQRLEEEIQETRDFYSRVHKTGDDGAVLTPAEVLKQRHGADEAASALRKYQGEVDEQDEAQLRKIEERAAVAANEISANVISEEKVEVKTETRNVFVDPNFDYEEELKYRTKDKPYVITHDEFFEGEGDYDNNSLTYYEQDDTLVDERDHPVDDMENIIGEDNLVRFGHGSKDRNIVYVRNDKLEIDYEIVKSPGSFLEALGLGPEPGGELKHSADRRREFRRGNG